MVVVNGIIAIIRRYTNGNKNNHLDKVGLELPEKFMGAIEHLV
jgi:hypothetical protein